MPRQFDVPDEVIQSVITQRSSPEVYSPYLASIYDQHVIGVNMAYKIGDWIDMVFFGDNKFFLMERERLAKFPGLKVTCNPKFASGRFSDERVKYLAQDKQHRHGISSNPGMVCWNTNSGAATISVAANAGVKRIVLLGFDMKATDGNQHWHSLYKSVADGKDGQKRTTRVSLPFRRHLLGFPEIARDAQRRGIEILNVSPDSAIDVFPKVSLTEALK